MRRYYVTDRRYGDVIESAKKAVEDGVDMIQVREKDLDARSLFELVCRIVQVARGSETRVLVNDRLDVALASGADGVHLPSTSLRLPDIRHRIELVGVSTHSVSEARAAEQGAADFIVFGPVFPTPGKNPVGLDALLAVTRAVRIPVFGIGGINPENATEVIDAGAAGIAAIRMFQ